MERMAPLQVYERYDSMKAVKVSPQGNYNNKFGNFALKVRCCLWLGCR